MEKFKKVSSSEEGVTLDIVFDGQLITASLKGNNGYGDEIEVKGKYTSSGESKKSQLINAAFTIWTEAASEILYESTQKAEESAKKLIQLARKGITFSFTDNAEMRKIKISSENSTIYETQERHLVLLAMLDDKPLLFEVADTLANLLHKR